MCAHQFALVQLQGLGFHTYSNVFDETYDELDNVVRMKDMIDSNWAFTREKLSYTEMENLYNELQGLINYNRDYFFDQFGDQMISELRMDLLHLWGK